MAHELDGIRSRGLEYLRATFGEEAVEHAVDVATRFTLDIPAWQFWEGFGGGGRFEGQGSGGVARTSGEIACDAGVVHSLTKSTPTVGQHMLWFYGDDGMTADIERARVVQNELAEQGLTTGSVSPTYFLAGSADGSFTSQDPEIRTRYIEQTILGARIAAEVGNGVLSLWWPDGTNYPGQRDLRDKIGLMRESVSAFWEGVPDTVKDALDSVLFEYKVFEPGTYSTSVPDWGTARELSMLVGDTGGVLVDMGHHHHGTNIEQIVATLIASGVRGGFHFNTRYAADDDHSVQGDYEMARLFDELHRGGVLPGGDGGEWVYALDQMARAEQRIPSVLRSVDALKRSAAKAALLDTGALAAAQRSLDLIAANEIIESALLHADTGPIVMESYHRQGLHPVPMIAYRESGYQQTIERDRI